MFFFNVFEKKNQEKLQNLYILSLCQLFKKKKKKEKSKIKVNSSKKKTMPFEFQ